MSRSTRQYSAFVGAKPKQDVTGYPWPHLQPMDHSQDAMPYLRPTVPAPRALDREHVAQQIAQYRAEASRLLARAADLEAALAAEDE